MPFTPTRLTNPTLPNGNMAGLFWSKDGTYLVMTSDATPYLFIYKRVANALTLLSTGLAALSGAALSGGFSPDNQWFVVSCLTAPYIYIYKNNGNDTFTLQTTPTTLPTASSRCSRFSPNGLYLTVSYDASPFMITYNFNTSTGVATNAAFSVATVPEARTFSSAWNIDATYLILQMNATPFTALYTRSGTTLTRVALPTGLVIAAQGQHVEFSPDNNYVAFSYAATPFLFAVAFDPVAKAFASTVTRIVPPNVGTITPRFNWFKDSRHLVYNSGSVAPGQFIANLTQAGTFISAGTMPTSLQYTQVQDIQFTPDGKFYAGGINNAAGLNSFNWFATGYIDQTTAAYGMAVTATGKVFGISSVVKDANNLVYYTRNDAKLLTLPSGSAFGVSMSADGQYMVIGGTNQVLFYAKNSSGAWQLITSDTTTSVVWDLAMSPDGSYVALSRTTGTPFFALWKRSGTGTGATYALYNLPVAVTYPSAASWRSKWSKSGQYLIAGSGGNFFVYKWTDSTRTQLVAIPNSGGGVAVNVFRDAVFSDDEMYFFTIIPNTATSATTYFAQWAFNNDHSSFSLVGVITTLSFRPVNIDFAKTTIIIVGGSGATNAQLFDYNPATGAVTPSTKTISLPTPGNNLEDVKISRDERYIFINNAITGKIDMYSLDKPSNTYLPFPTNIDNPTTTFTANSALAITDDLQQMVAVGSTTPYAAAFTMASKDTSALFAYPKPFATAAAVTMDYKRIAQWVKNTSGIATLPSTPSFGVSMSAHGAYMVISGTNLTSFYAKDTSGVYVLVTQDTTGQSAWDMSMSPDGMYVMANRISGTPLTAIWKRTGTGAAATYAIMSLPILSQSGAAWGSKWSKSGRYLIVGSTNGFIVYGWTDATKTNMYVLTKSAGSFAAGTFRNAVFSDDENYFYVVNTDTGAGTTSLTQWIIANGRLSYSQGALVATPVMRPANIDFAKGTVVVTGYDLANNYVLFDFNPTTGALTLSAKTVNAPGGNIEGVRISRDERYINGINATTGKLETYFLTAGVYQPVATVDLPSTGQVGVNDSIDMTDDLRQMVTVGTGQAPYAISYSLVARDVTGLTTYPVFAAASRVKETVKTTMAALYPVFAHADSVKIKTVVPTMTLQAAPSGLSPLAATKGVAWSSDGTYLVVYTSGTPYIAIYTRSGDTLTRLTGTYLLGTNAAPNNEVYSGNAVTNPLTGADGGFIVVSTVSSFFRSFTNTGANTWTRQAIAVSPDQASNNWKMSYDGKLAVAALQASPWISMQEVTYDAGGVLSGAGAFTALTVTFAAGSTPTAQPIRIVLSPDNRWVLATFGVSAWYALYRVDNLDLVANTVTLTRVTGNTIVSGDEPTAISYGVAFDPTSTHFMVGSTDSQGLRHYKIKSLVSTTDAYTRVYDFPAISGGCSDIHWSRSGVILAATLIASPGVRAWVWSAATQAFKVIQDPSGVTYVNAKAIEVSRDDQYIAVTYLVSPYLAWFKIPSNAAHYAFAKPFTAAASASVNFRKIAQWTKNNALIGTQPPASSFGVTMTPHAAYMIISGNNFVNFYAKNASGVWQLVTQDTTTQAVWDMDISPDGMWAAVCRISVSGQPILQLYQRTGSGIAATYAPYTMPIPVTLPTSSWAARWSPSGNYLIVGNAGSFIVYGWTDSTRTQLQVLTKTTGTVGAGTFRGAAFSDDEKYFFTLIPNTSTDGNNTGTNNTTSLAQWVFSNDHTSYSLVGVITTLAFRPYNIDIAKSMIVVTGNGGTQNIQLFDMSLTTGAVTVAVRLMGNPVPANNLEAVRISRDRRYILTSNSSTGKIDAYYYDSSTGAYQPVATIDVPTTGFTTNSAFAISHDLQQIVVAGQLNAPYAQAYALNSKDASALYFMPKLTLNALLKIPTLVNVAANYQPFSTKATLKNKLNRFPNWIRNNAQIDAQPPNSVYGVALSKSGHYMVAAGTNNIEVYAMDATGKYITVYQNTTATGFTEIDISPDGIWVIAGRSGNPLTILQRTGTGVTATYAPVTMAGLTIPATLSYFARWSKSGKFLLVGNQQNFYVYGWTDSTKTQLTLIAKNSGPHYTGSSLCRGGVFSDDEMYFFTIISNQAVSTSTDGIDVWKFNPDRQSYEYLGNVAYTARHAQNVDFGGGKLLLTSLIAASGNNYLIFDFNPANGVLAASSRTVNAPNSDIEGSRISQDGRIIVAISKSTGNLESYVFDGANYQPITLFDFPQTGQQSTGVQQIAMSADERMVVVGGATNSPYIEYFTLDVNQGTSIYNYPAYSGLANVEFPIHVNAAINYKGMTASDSVHVPYGVLTKLAYPVYTFTAVAGIFAKEYPEELAWKPKSVIAVVSGAKISSETPDTPFSYGDLLFQAFTANANVHQKIKSNTSMLYPAGYVVQGLEGLIKVSPHNADPQMWTYTTYSVSGMVDDIYHVHSDVFYPQAEGISGSLHEYNRVNSQVVDMEYPTFQVNGRVSTNTFRTHIDYPVFGQEGYLYYRAFGEPVYPIYSINGETEPPATVKINFGPYTTNSNIYVYRPVNANFTYPAFSLGSEGIVNQPVYVDFAYPANNSYGEVMVNQPVYGDWTYPAFDADAEGHLPYGLYAELPDYPVYTMGGVAGVVLVVNAALNYKPFVAHVAIGYTLDLDMAAKYPKYFWTAQAGRIIETEADTRYPLFGVALQLDPYYGIAGDDAPNLKIETDGDIDLLKSPRRLVVLTTI